ncbi:MAG: rSAM/selenodomain-associated transferase 1 [Flavobacteriaceae bacterium]|jgi:rSAM/selenodomain-associated transferase 1
MQSTNLLVVFVKNPVKGKAKTRLAATIGDAAALEVYKRLIAITEKATSAVDGCDLHVYFSSETDEKLWSGKEQFVQKGSDLGERMFGAFDHGFNLGYERIAGVGSDLPDLTAETIQKGFKLLEEFDTVFGPSDDGGYYLIGMTKKIRCIFENKAWSTEGLLNDTLTELNREGYSSELLEVLNDVDTVEDLRSSSLAQHFTQHLQS